MLASGSVNLELVDVNLELIFVNLELLDVNLELLDVNLAIFASDNSRFTSFRTIVNFYDIHILCYFYKKCKCTHKAKAV